MQHQEADQEAVTRTLRGGATAFPRETPRPPALPFLPILRNFIVETVRGPFIATVLTKLTYPTFIRIAKRMHGENERGIFVSTMTIVHVMLYAGMFAFFELFGNTEWLRQYQLARTPAQVPTWQMKSRVLKDFVIGTVVNYVAVLPIGHYLFTRFGGMPSVYSKLPSLWKVYLHIVCSLHCSQFLFAIAHRILHHGPLYRAIHKKHHEFVGTITIAAENSHPVENLFANVIPTVTGAFVLGLHPYVFFVWIAWRLEQTLESHSGFCFHGSWLHNIGLTHSDSTAFHDFHHTENKGAFGSEMADYMFGTLDAWILVGQAEGYVRQKRLQ